MRIISPQVLIRPIKIDGNFGQGFNALFMDAQAIQIKRPQSP